MSESVGGIHYEVDLDTRKLIDANRKVGRNLADTNGMLDGMQAKLTATAAAAAALGAALLAMKVAERADEFRLLSARVDVAAGSMESGASAFADLVDISRRTQSSLASNIEVFTRLNQSLLQMGGTQRDTLQLIELLAKAIKVSGASAVEGKAAMLQFGQALGSGKLAGDELRSLLENAPYLMRQLAAGIGVPVGSLKKLGEEGKLTADVVVNALTKAAETIDADFKKFPQTIEAAMVVAADSASLAAMKLDELTGTSAALAGVGKGLGEVLDELGKQFGAANDEAGKLGRNEAVRSWADTARTGLSYLIDAADLTWQTLSVLGRNVSFVFKGIGTEIGGLAAQAVAVARGDFSGAAAIGRAMKADAEQRRRELDAADAKTLGRAKLAGQQMREAWEQGAGGGRGSIIPGGPPSKLKATGGDDKKKGAPFDAAAYIAGLAKEVATEYQKVDVIEREALRKNDQLLAQKKISHEQHQQAITLIEQNAAQDRAAIAKKDSDAAIARQIEYGAAEEANALKLAEQRKRSQQAALDMKLANDPIAQLQIELERKKELLAIYAAEDQANEQLYAEAAVALEHQTQDRIRQIREKEMADRAAAQSAQLTAYGSLFGNMADIAKAFGGKQNGVYKAMFAASKAFALADAAIKIQQGIAGAAALPFPANIPAIASVVAATASIISTISGVSYGGGRQYGGPVSAGSLYKVNETGRPEMFTGSNGSQYMLPTKSGSVTPADQVGGGGGGQAWNIIIQNAPAGTRASVDDQSRTVMIAVGEVASQISNNSGPVWSALRGASNVAPRQ